MAPHRLFVILGDQLDRRALDDFDPQHDAVWMAEVDSEATHVRAHKQRILMFLSAMRHFRDELRDEGIKVSYRELPPEADRDEPKDHRAALLQDLPQVDPSRIVLTQPGDFRVLESIRAAARAKSVDLEVREDRHFIAPVEVFNEWAKNRKRPVLEHFYRMLRKREGVLLEPDAQPVGGAWNFDADNRKSFGRQGPPPIPPAPGHREDALTRAVRTLVAKRFSEHPGNLDSFNLPLTSTEARAFADHFIEHALPQFGPHQDAMWADDPVLWHSRLSAPLNLKLVDPRYLVDRAVEAYRAGQASIQSVEGFVRQVLGWREFIRGIYWSRMPEYAELNELECADRDVPRFFWTGETDMACVATSVRHLLERGYVHHIHRLMVLGLFALQLGVHPYRFHEWHMAMYLDAVDWVSLPNALGMSQFGDGGVVGTKPYSASGKYIKKMSNFCSSCRYRPEEATGEAACPFTTLYWDFLAGHRQRLSTNSRMQLQLKNVDRKSTHDLDAIRRRAREIRMKIDAGERI